MPNDHIGIGPTEYQNATFSRGALLELLAVSLSLYLSLSPFPKMCIKTKVSTLVPLL